MTLFSKSGLAGFVIGAVAAIGISKGVERARELYLERQYTDGIQIAEEFHTAMNGCNASSRLEFPENKYCKRALALLVSGPVTVNDDDYIGNLQDRLSFFATYSEWLECQAGVSVIGRVRCGKKVEYIEMRD